MDPRGTHRRIPRALAPGCLRFRRTAADFRIIDETQFKFADEAKKSIGKDGYFLMGARVTTTEAFGRHCHSNALAWYRRAM